MRRWLWNGCAAVLFLSIGIWAGMCVEPGSGSATSVAAPAQPDEEDALEQFRTERQQLRQMQMAQLNEIIYGGETDEEIAVLAQQRQMELMEWAEQEMTIEGVLRMREFEDVAATVHNDSVNVMVRTDGLNQQQTAVILELVMRETGISGGNVKIVPIN